PLGEGSKEISSDGILRSLLLPQDDGVEGMRFFGSTLRMTK
ncbi:MAG: hypothetical protein XD95_0736, partial [Microgenomates bacterium 39_7]